MWAYLCRLLAHIVDYCHNFFQIRAPRNPPDAALSSNEGAREASSYASGRGVNSAQEFRRKSPGEGKYKRLDKTQDEARNLRGLLDAANIKVTNLEKSQQELSDRLRKSDVAISKANDQVRALQRKREEIETELEAARDGVKTLRHSLDAAKDENADLSKSKRELFDKLKGSKDTIAKANDDIRMLQEHIQQQAGRIADSTRDRDQLAQTTRELDACRRQKQDIEALLQVRTAELQDAQQYLAKVDAVSYADVKRMVETLNSHIYQLAAQIVDTFPFEEMRPRPATTLVQACCEDVSKVLGCEDFASVVSTSAHADDTMLVQVMIQAYLARRISDVIYAWVTTDIDKSWDNVFSTIYDNIRKNESQSASARWRILTRRYVDLPEARSGEYSLKVKSDVVHGLSRVLVLSGVKIVETIEDNIDGVFGGRIEDIVSKALEVRKIVGEGMTTNEFEVLCPKYGRRFCHDTMEDVDKSATDQHNVLSDDKAVILCATDLGLRRNWKRAAAGDGKEEWEGNVLLKANVVLQSLIGDFDNQSKGEVVEVPDVQH